MRAMHSPVGIAIASIGAILFFLLAVSTIAVLISLSLFLVRRGRFPPRPD